MNNLPQIKNSKQPNVNVNMFFILFIFCFIFIIIGVISYFSNSLINNKIQGQGQEKKESFINKKTIILLGDSLLNNSKYVPSGKSIYDLISINNNTSINVINYAMDDASILNVYNQLNKISIDLNDSNTFIFLSIGGNDLLKIFSYSYSQSQSYTDSDLDSDFYKMIEKYNVLVKSIESRLPFTNLILLTLFYPPDSNTFKDYYKYIEKWNNNIIDNYKNYIDLSTFINNENDVVETIEPSETGGKKIASRIYSYVNVSV
jgi:hypothetical protein